MNMRSYCKAFEMLQDTIPSARGVDVVRLYANVCSIYRDMRACAEQIPERDRPASYHHTMEKLVSWLDTVREASLPGVTMTLSDRDELIERARGYLVSARSNWPGDNWE